MNKYYLVVLILIALVSSLWSAEAPSEDTPVSFFGITLGEYIPQDAVEKVAATVPKGFDGRAVLISPLTGRVTSVSVGKKLSDEAKAVKWMDTLVSGLALSVNAQLVWDKDQEAYHFAKGRLNVTVWQTGSSVYVCVTDEVNDGVHGAIEDARGWAPPKPLLPDAPAEKPAKKPAEKPVPTPAKK